ncbi:hypothetical protein N8K70_02830 [Microbacterium betulae]|uniref:Uncharacterized protein n=1 Tax=Microbacterium betulae TaxID=2981139 RepID=A0AA97FLH8_9MICO|nr:hypothetical protein [Microbacterium sp. AB]WOF23632.1 hypothetical protein N8K70_02830 [Microbacterium sp. AB]
MASLVSFGVAASASAAEEPPVSPETQIFEEGGTLTAEQAAELDALESATDFGAKTFDIGAAEDTGASAQGIADFAHVLETQGWTTIGGGLTVSPSTATAQIIATAAAACTGKSGYTGFYGAFWQWALNSCQTDTLIAGVAAGAAGAGAVAAVFAAVGVAPAAGVSTAIGALVGANAAFLTVCKTASYGVHAIYLNAYVTGGVGCWGQ